MRHHGFDVVEISWNYFGSTISGNASLIIDNTFI